MQVTWIGCYQKLPRHCTLASHTATFVSLHITPLITKPSEQITDIPGDGGYDKHNVQKGKVAGGVPSVGGIEYFQDRHIWTYGDLDSAMLVKYSISETPCCFIYFIFINRKFASQYPQVSSHNLRCKFNFETDTQFNINWSNVATCSTKLMFNSVSYMYHVKCCWIEQGSISCIQQVGIS